MSHAFVLSSALSAAVLALSIGMIKPPFLARLVPSARLADRFAPAASRARGRAVAIPTIAPAAQKEDLAAIPNYADYKAK